MKSVRELLSNQILLTAVAADAAAQVLKALIVYLSEREWNLERLFGSGGMPSSHSSLVSALAAGVAITRGLDSPLFAVSAILALVVMYDAFGVRRAAGKHAHILNELVLELRDVLDQGFKPEVLKTFLGHTLMQVFFGMLLGVSVALFSFYVWPA